MTVYLIHLDQPLSNQSQHYIGWTESEKTLANRLKHHQNGTGARFLSAANDALIPYQIARVWKYGDKHFERRLKNRKKARELCPICNPRNWQNNSPE